MSLKTFGLAGLAVATLLGSTALTVQSADARPGFRGGGFYRGAGFYGRGFYGRGYYGRGFYGGGLGLGLASGLAFGALAASTYPYYGGGYYSGYGPAYYGGGYASCYLQPQRVYGPYGWTYASVRVCY